VNCGNSAENTYIYEDDVASETGCDDLQVCFFDYGTIEHSDSPLRLLR
jgi:hypothetical protein